MFSIVGPIETKLGGRIRLDPGIVLGKSRLRLRSRSRSERLKYENEETGECRRHEYRCLQTLVEEGRTR